MPLGTRDVFADGTLQILYGGTRKKLNLSRPWQRSIGETAEASKTTCPFETKPQIELDRMELEGETWLVLDNIMTPYEFHRLVIPEKCWPEEKLRTLGGAQGIGSALKMAAKIGKDNQKYGKLWIGVHVGWHAGQNLYHPHYHVIEPLSALDVKGNAEESPGLDVTETAVMKSETMAVHCAGCITGQCWISFDTQELRDYTQAWNFMERSCRHDGTHELAVTLANLIALYNERFRSTQGLPPDFNLWLEMENGYPISGMYTPILNQIGFDGYAAIARNTPFVLAWSHADTARHLLEKNE